jgi:hypothetical protein
MPEENTPPSIPPSSPALAVVTVRPLRYADLDGVDAGDQGVVLYQVRSHAGDVTLDRSEVKSITSAPVYLREHRRSPEGHAPVGVKKSVSVRSVYGSEINIHLYDNTDAFDADFPPHREGTDDVADRQRALARQSDPGVYIEDPDGDMTLPVTLDWGSQVYVSVLVPDLDPDTLVTVIAKTLDEQFPGYRLVKLQARWAAERRVNVYRPAVQPAGHEGLPGPPHTPLASNVLEAEAVAFPRTFRVEQVKSNAPRSTAGDRSAPDD